MYKIQKMHCALLVPVYTDISYAGTNKASQVMLELGTSLCMS